MLTRRSCPPLRATGLVLCLMLVGLAAVALEVRRPRAAPVESEWEAITVLYHSDVGGKIEPCG